MSATYERKAASVLCVHMRRRRARERTATAVRGREGRRGRGRDGLRDVQGGEGEEGALVEVVPGHERDVGDFPSEELPLGRLR